MAESTQSIKTAALAQIICKDFQISNCVIAWIDEDCDAHVGVANLSYDEFKELIGNINNQIERDLN